MRALSIVSRLSNKIPSQLAHPQTHTRMCTGVFEKYGSPYEQDEYAQRENTLLEEYYENLRSDEPQPDRFEYDEDGIIIREL